MFDYSLRVGKDGTIKLPDDVLQHYALGPGSCMKLTERPDGIIELRHIPEDNESQDWFFNDYPDAEIKIKRNSRREL